jgi:hypothetical protein
VRNVFDLKLALYPRWIWVCYLNCILPLSRPSRLPRPPPVRKNQARIPTSIRSFQFPL